MAQDVGLTLLEEIAHMTGRPAPDRRSIQRHKLRDNSSRPRRWLAFAGYGGLALLCLGLASLAFVLVAPPLDAVRDRLVKEVDARSGRTLTVAGPMSVTLFPRVVVSLSDVALLPPEDMEGVPTVTVPSLDAEMSLWSLIARRPRLDRVTLNRPTIDLAVDAQGRSNWALAPPRRRRPAQPPSAGQAEADRDTAGSAERTTSARPRRPRPWAVRVVDGTLRYRDERSGARYEIGALSLDMAADDVAGAVAINGALAWQGVPLRLSGTVSAGQPAQVALKLAGAPVEAVYEGSLGLGHGVTGDGTLSLEHLVYKGLKIGPAVLAVSVSDGIARLTLQDARLYGGTASGSLTLDATGAALASAMDLKLADVSMRPLLADAAGVAWLDGRGAVTLALRAQGRSERQILETLQGKMQVAVADGAVTGIDIDKTIRRIQRGRLGNLSPRPDDRTSFSELTATFDIGGGIAKNDDLKLASTHVQMSGEGTIDLLPRRIDYTLRTKIAGGPPDDGAVITIGSLEIPVAIKGPLERPDFTIKGQEGLTDALKQIGRNLRSREVQDAIKDLFSGNGEKRVRPADLLDKLLKKE